MSIGYRQVFAQQLIKDWRQYGRNLGAVMTPVLFFAVIISLFPLSLEPDAALLAKIAPGMVWVAALLSALLSMQGLFKQDFEDGSLHLMVLSEAPLWFQVLAKQIAHWTVSGLPLLLMAPIAAYALSLATSAYYVLLISLFFGTWILSSIGLIGAALTVAMGHGGLLFSILVLPLITPVLILGSQASGLAGNAIAEPTQVTGALYMMISISIMAFCLAPFAAAWALRVNLE